MEQRASITVKLDKEIKSKFNNICESIGLNMNSVLNAFILKTIRDKGISFYINEDEATDEEKKIIKMVEKEIEKNGTIELNSVDWNL